MREGGVLMGGIGHSPDFKSEKLRAGFSEEFRRTYGVAPKSEADMVKAVAEALDRERKHREALVVRIASLENEKATLEARVERLEKFVLDRHTK